MKKVNPNVVKFWDKAEQLTETELDESLNNLSEDEFAIVADDFLNEHEQLMNEVQESKQKAIDFLSKKNKKD
jgi:hypothetical protein